MTPSASSPGSSPRVGLGLMVFNEERYVAEAIESLLDQTFGDFTLYVVDDCSEDATWSIVQSFAEEDSRIRTFRNQTRGGYGANYLKTFALSGGEHELWAWAAGHDRHHPEWLEAMVQALDDNPDAVMAHPLTVRISESGERYEGYPPPRFETVGMDMRSRIKAMREGEYRMGDMIYGLFRTEALERAGVFPQYLLPDAFLIWRLARYGTIVQVPEELWYRRFVGLFSIQRQRRNMFGSPPWYSFLPWPLVNTAALFGSSVVRADGGWRARWHGLRLTGAFLARYWPHLVTGSKWLSRILERPIQLYRRWKRPGITT